MKKALILATLIVSFTSSVYAATAPSRPCAQITEGTKEMVQYTDSTSTALYHELTCVAVLTNASGVPLLSSGAAETGSHDKYDLYQLATPAQITAGTNGWRYIDLLATQGGSGLGTISGMKGYLIPGDYVFQAPSGVNSVRIIGCGGGGGGGQATGDNPPYYTQSIGGPGGSGGCAVSTVDVSPGATYAIHVGQGGYMGANSYLLPIAGGGGQATTFGVWVFGGGGGGGGSAVYGGARGGRGGSGGAWSGGGKGNDYSPPGLGCNAPSGGPGAGSGGAPYGYPGINPAITASNLGYDTTNHNGANGGSCSSSGSPAGGGVGHPNAFYSPSGLYGCSPGVGGAGGSALQGAVAPFDATMGGPGCMTILW